MRRHKGRAVVFVRPRRAEVHDDVLFPAMNDESVVIRTGYSVISRGTELDLYTNQMHGRGEQGQWYPMLPGYMPCGEVIEAGGKVSHLQVGDRAIASNLFGGFDERYCCAWGGHCEYIVVGPQSHPWHGARRALKVPDEIASEHAALAVLGAVALHGIEAKVRPQEGETVLVVGQGVIGNFAAQLCKASGARVIVSDLEEWRLAVSRACGIEETIDASQEALATAVAELTDGQGPEAVIDVTGDPRVLESLLPMARSYGRVHAQGMYLEPVSVYLPETLFGRNLTLSSTCGEQPEHTARVLEHMASGRLTYKPLLSEVMPVQAATDAYERVHCRPGDVMTVALKW